MNRYQVGVRPHEAKYAPGYGEAEGSERINAENILAEDSCQSSCCGCFCLGEQDYQALKSHLDHHLHTCTHMKN